MLRSLGLLLIILLIGTLPAAAQGTTDQQPAEAGQSIIAAPELFENGMAALETANYEEAVLNFSLVTLLNPTFSQGYYGRSIGYLGIDEVDLALEDAERALETAQQADYRAAVYALIGDLYAQAGDIDETIEAYTEAAEIAPSADSYGNLAIYLVQAGRFEDAVSALDEAIALAPDNPFMRVYRAFTFTQIGELDNAAEDYYAFIGLIETDTQAGRPLRDGAPQFIDITEGTVYRFAFEAERGQTLTIRAEARPNDQIDPLLVLLDPDGVPVAADDDTGRGAGGVDARIDGYSVPADGTYTIVVTHSLGGPQGEVAVGVDVEAE